VLWLAFLNGLRQRDRAHLDRPVDLYTTAQVEDLVLTASRAHHVWQTQCQKTRQLLRYSVEPPLSERSVILFEMTRGGRWVFIMWDDGSVYFWDTQEPTAGPRNLLPSILGLSARKMLRNASLLTHTDKDFMTIDLIYTIWSKSYL
jgi:hypothetical protein